MQVKLFGYIRWLLALACGYVCGASYLPVMAWLCLLVAVLAGWEVIVICWKRACALKLPDAPVEPRMSWTRHRRERGGGNGQ